ncbi:hypothetical protein IFM89_013237 [Coptis chinensis]|uniref:Protease Do-like 5, chloroplastic n=1 Tax=Coptis chinensis TaxID=261450 RepID=A0A835M8Q8_9MAGN|nr:hypothetical protein IFM89_013237 [Coptis chinensis]
MVALPLGSLQASLAPPPTSHTSSSSSTNKSSCCCLSTTRRNSILLASSILATFLDFSLTHSLPLARALDDYDTDDEFQQQEERMVHLFQETSPSVVLIKDIELEKNSNNSNEVMLLDDENAKVEGTGSGFIWDKTGHIVTNYHVIEKLATNASGLQRCKYVRDFPTGIYYQYTYFGFTMQVDVEGSELKPVMLGTSRDLHVGQSCFAIGNPYGYENTLTTGVVSGLGREIPSPNGSAIRGAIQTDAAINAGNSGGPLIDSYGHVIGVSTATFTRKGSGLSSGVNFAIPVDTVVRTVPYLIVSGTPFSNRY